MYTVQYVIKIINYHYTDKSTMSIYPTLQYAQWLMLAWLCLLFWQPSTQYISQFTVPAVEGFFRSIALSHGSSLQDTLRLLTLWFDYGQWPEVYDAIVEGIRTIEIDTWLQVLKNVLVSRKPDCSHSFINYNFCWNTDYLLLLIRSVHLSNK